MEWLPCPSSSTDLFDLSRLNRGQVLFLQFASESVLNLDFTIFFFIGVRVFCCFLVFR